MEGALSVATQPSRRRKRGAGRVGPLRVRPVPVQLDETHPDPPHPSLPKHEFTLGFIAPKGRYDAGSTIPCLRP